MIRRFMPYDLDDSQFQVIRETRGNRRHLIIVPPAKPGCSPREAGIYESLLSKNLREPWYNWLSFEALNNIMLDELVYPYVVIDGIRVENAYGSEKMQENSEQLLAYLEKMEALCNQGHEDDKTYLGQVEELSENVLSCAMKYADFMLDAGLRTGLRLGQKLRPDELDEDAQDWR